MLDKYLHEIIMQLGKNSSSRAASTSSTSERRERELVQTSNMLISVPVMNEPTRNEEKEPVVIDLQEYARSGKAAASVQSINKVKEIHDFINNHL